MDSNESMPGTCSSSRSGNTSGSYTVCAMYLFVELPDYADLRPKILRICEQNQAVGTILLAREGINGTIGAPGDGIENILNFLRKDPRFGALDAKYSWADEKPFYRMKVKLKREIVTMGVDDANPNHLVGQYVEPEDWNRLISDPDVVVVDTRNDYEYQIGTFQNALNPNTRTFREFPEYVNHQLIHAKQKKIAMFCTGGIRCEKATSYLLSRGFENVYHLKGGILKYLEKIPGDQSLWQGECFVFDNRVTVRDGLEPGNYDQCHACRHPISDQDKQSPHFQRGVSCPYCFESQSDENRRKAEARQLQVELAELRKQEHIGQKLRRHSQSTASTE